MRQTVTIGGTEYLFVTHYENDPVLWPAFNRLAKEVFDFSFENWQEKGGNAGAFRPHTLFDGERAAANISVMPFRCSYDGKPHTFLGLYTVMVHPDYRRKGLARHIMEHILEEWNGRCDQMFLYANNKVLDFYPKFGFAPVQEQRFYRISVAGQPGMAMRRMDMDTPADFTLLRRRTAKAVPLARLSVEDFWESASFHALWPLKGCFYDCTELEAVYAYNEDDSGLFLYDIFCNSQTPFETLLQAIPLKTGQRLFLGFTPPDENGWLFEPIHREDATTFLLTGKDELFSKSALCFPELWNA